FLLTQTSETTLNAILDAALGADKRKLGRFFDLLGTQDLSATIRNAHGAGELRAIASWLAAGSKTDSERAADLAAALAMTPGAPMFKAYREVWLTKEGLPRKDPVTRRHSASRPDLRELVDKLQADLVAVEERPRAAHSEALP